MEQMAECRTCGKQYEVESDCATDQSVCPACRWAEENSEGERKPLDLREFKKKFNIGG